MNIYPFSVGPIVGAVTATSMRLWGRGLQTIEAIDSMPYLGVARLKKDGDRDYGLPKFFPLSPLRDHTGTIEFDQLSPSTHYTYQIGWVPVDSPPAELHWDDSVHQGKITTASENPTEPRTLVFGSCRYLLRIRERFFFKAIGDRTFEQIRQSGPIDRFLMLGDQIYADDLGTFFPDKTLADYNRRYRVAFAQPHLRALMASTPTAMMLDDHEITNNWPVNAKTKQEESVNHPLYGIAMQAFFNYQLSHSPAFSLKPEGYAPQHHWYQFQDGCCDFFVADVRTQRSLSEQKIISDDQMAAIKAWLLDGRDRVKILASSVLIFPDSSKFNPDEVLPSGQAAILNSDQWCGFRTQQFELLDFIRNHHLRRVVFLSGDVHASFSAKLTHREDPTFQVLSIVSSPFFWPAHHSKAKNFQLEGRLGTSPYEIQNHSDVMSQDNFTQVRVTPDSVTLSIIPRKALFCFRKPRSPIEYTYSFSHH